MVQRTLPTRSELNEAHAAIFNHLYLALRDGLLLVPQKDLPETELFRLKRMNHIITIGFQALQHAHRSASEVTAYGAAALYASASYDAAQISFGAIRRAVFEWKENRTEDTKLKRALNTTYEHITTAQDLIDEINLYAPNHQKTPSRPMTDVTTGSYL